MEKSALARAIRIRQPPLKVFVAAAYVATTLMTSRINPIIIGFIQFICVTSELTDDLYWRYPEEPSLV